MIKSSTSSSSSCFFEVCVSLYYTYNYLYINKLYNIIKDITPLFFELEELELEDSDSSLLLQGINTLRSGLRSPVS